MENLSARWDWAVSQAKQDAQFKNGGWIAYSIDRLMRENSWIGSFRTGSFEKEITLYEVITGIHLENPVDRLRQSGRSYRSRSEKEEEKKVIKEVALLFRFSDASSPEEHIREVQPTNISLSVELDGLPILWLGKAKADESLELLKGLYGKVTSERQKRRIIMASWMHETRQAYPLLRSIAEGDEGADVRKDAVFWMGQIGTDEALEFLNSFARKEKSRKVAEQAVFAISQIKSDKAMDVLIDLGKNGPSREIRKKAVFWLGQQVSSKVLDTLKDFAYDGEDVEVQKQAVFALTQLPHDEGLPEIIRIAKTHPQPSVRKQAIFWLGESDDPKAFDAIVEIAKGK